MKKIAVFLVASALAVMGWFHPVAGEEILLKSGKKVDYGPTWEKDGMVWFYLDDKGVVGLSKSAIVDKKGFLGTVEDKNFVSREYKFEMLVPQAWKAANAMQALDVMPMDEKIRSQCRKLEMEELMKKMGFLAIIYQNEAWNPSTYNPNITVKIEDQDTYPGVETPLDYLKNSEFLLKTLYKRFSYSQAPESFILNSLPCAKQKFSCDMIMNGKPANITQWQYAFIRNRKIYVVSALNTTDEYRQTEPIFLKALKSFQFLN